MAGCSGSLTTNTVPPALIALISAVCFAATQVTAKRGLQTVSVEASLVVSLGSAWIVIALATSLTSPQPIEPTAAVLFAISGLITPGVSRWAAVTAVDKLGPSLSTPLQQGLRPLLAVAAAMLILGENVGAVRAFGIGCIVCGGWVLGTVRPATLSDAPGGGNPAPLRPRRTLRPGLIWAFIASLSYATSDIVVKHTLADAPEPFLGATIGIGAAWLAWGIMTSVVPRVRRRLRFGPGIRWFLLSGALAGAANLALFAALERGDVSLVAPVIGSQPLIVFALSRLFLRGIESIDRSTVVAGLLVVAGTMLVAL